MKWHALPAFLCALLASAPAVTTPSLPSDPPFESIRTIPATAFKSATGRDGERGREVDYSRDRPGFALLRPQEPLLLEPGLYRATFILRRGNYPSEGLLRPTFEVFRIGIFDATEGTLLIERELQVCEFDRANSYDARWLEFSMTGREGHIVEPRVYWPGLVNGEIEAVRIERMPVETPAHLEEKARLIAETIVKNNLENGYVVPRIPNGDADETEDAVTYTAFYAAALSWKFSQTHDAITSQELENAMQSLHNAVKGTPDQPIITRFVDKQGTPASKSPSKDVYTAFFFACSAAYPVIQNDSLKMQIRNDVNRIATRFLKDDLTIRGGPTTLASLTPYFDPRDLKVGVQALAEKTESNRVLKNLQDAKRYVPFQEMWPGMKDLMSALQKRDEKKLLELVVPTMNGAITVAERMIDLLKESSRDDLVHFRGPQIERPGKKLVALLNEALKKLPPAKNGRRFQRPSDLRVLASNALLALHIVKTAAAITGSAQFEEYYRQNLYAQEALLKTALDWYGIEDDGMRLTAGNAIAAQERQGYLALLAIYNLYGLEKNPGVKESYRTLLAREVARARLDDNPLPQTLAAAANIPSDKVTLWRALTLYPENPVGFGGAYWKENGHRIAEAFGAGESDGFSREPLPVSQRPRDSFLWQRNSHRIKGDATSIYPGTDYLFLYWLARKHGLVPAAPSESTVQIDR